MVRAFISSNASSEITPKNPPVTAAKSMSRTMEAPAESPARSGNGTTRAAAARESPGRIAAWRTAPNAVTPAPENPIRSEFTSVLLPTSSFVPVSTPSPRTVIRPPPPPDGPGPLCRSRRPPTLAG